MNRDGSTSSLRTFFDTLSPNPDDARRPPSFTERHWNDKHAVTMLELARFAHGRSDVEQIPLRLARGAGQSQGFAVNKWYKWIWHKNPGAPPHYPQFIAALYRTGRHGWPTGVLPGPCAFDRVWIGVS